MRHHPTSWKITGVSPLIIKDLAPYLHHLPAPAHPHSTRKSPLSEEASRQSQRALSEGFMQTAQMTASRPPFAEWLNGK